eukprot:COSAG04_NODE_454_length_14092_cov_330.378261_5_plen_262_part_00
MRVATQLGCGAVVGLICRGQNRATVKAQQTRATGHIATGGRQLEERERGVRDGRHAGGRERRVKGLGVAPSTETASIHTRLAPAVSLTRRQSAGCAASHRASPSGTSAGWRCRAFLRQPLPASSGDRRPRSARSPPRSSPRRSATAPPCDRSQAGQCVSPRRELAAGWVAAAPEPPRGVGSRLRQRFVLRDACACDRSKPQRSGESRHLRKRPGCRLCWRGVPRSAGRGALSSATARSASCANPTSGPAPAPITQSVTDGE